VSATGAYAVTGSHDKTVRIWAAQTGQLLRTIRLPQGPEDVGKVYAVAITPDGVLVAAGRWTVAEARPEQIYLFDRDTGALVRRLDGLPNVIFHLVFSPTGRYLAATLGGANGLRMYDRDAGWREVARDDAYGDASYSAAFAADGGLATTSWDGTLRLYDGAFQRVATARTTDGTKPSGIAFSPAGDRLAVGYDDTTAVSLFDGRALTRLPGPDTSEIGHGNLASVAWSADGATLYAGGRYQRAGISPVVAWSQAGAGPRRELAAGTNTLMSLRPLPDGGLLVGAQDPWFALLDAAGAPRWAQRPPQADWRGQRKTLRVSASVADTPALGAPAPWQARLETVQCHRCNTDRRAPNKHHVGSCEQAHIAFEGFELFNIPFTVSIEFWEPLVVELLHDLTQLPALVPPLLGFLAKLSAETIKMEIALRCCSR
jgi:hypothetical protein